MVADAQLSGPNGYNVLCMCL